MLEQRRQRQRIRALAAAFTGMNSGRMNSANSAASPTPTAPNKPSCRWPETGEKNITKNAAIVVSAPNTSAGASSRHGAAQFCSRWPAANYRGDRRRKFRNPPSPRSRCCRSRAPPRKPGRRSKKNASNAPSSAENSGSSASRASQRRRQAAKINTAMAMVAMMLVRVVSCADHRRRCRAPTRCAPVTEIFTAPAGKFVST